MSQASPASAVATCGAMARIGGLPKRDGWFQDCTRYRAACVVTNSRGVGCGGRSSCRRRRSTIHFALRRTMSSSLAIDVFRGALMRTPRSGSTAIATVLCRRPRSITYWIDVRPNCTIECSASIIASCTLRRSTIRPARESRTVAIVDRFAAPVRRNRPGRRSSSMLRLMASRISGARCTSSITARSKPRMKARGSLLAAAKVA